MQAMTKPTYTAIVQHAKNGKPVLVFVPSRKYVRLIAVDLMTYSRIDGDQNSAFLLRSHENFEEYLSGISEEMLRATLRLGVRYLHEGLNSSDQEVVSELFKGGFIQVCVMSSSFCWGVPLTAHLVFVMGTQYYDGQENAHTDYPVADLLRMMGHADRPLLGNSGKCVILCHAPRKEYYKKFLYEASPVESHLYHFLHDNFNAEVVAGVIENKQDAVDYLTWTFVYRRLTQNPNYYNLQGVNHRHLSDHLSELVENTLSDLAASKCILIENDMDVSPSNHGMIASYYYISYTAIERFGSFLTPKTKMKGLLEILASASGYVQLPIRPGEEEVVRSTLLEAISGWESVDAPRYPKAKDEGWWMLVGDTKTNQLVAIKRVSLQRKSRVKLDFAAPADAGKKSYTLYFMCDSYLGCDQEYSLTVDVKEVGGPDEGSERE
ncbi:hypothetical protein Pint_30913 [Pistacia integerrima]|uniref:Uncharacterized protein n=1 Tax=Pistacia integerrima TaxID=434235 RepID=A0ACC0XRU0_9ROSI|nr:hypothetical protein Pint_30913 [Pistacia integerrima]